MASKNHADRETADAEKLYGGYYKYDETVARTYERDREGEIHWQQENDFIAQHFAHRDINNLLDVPVGTGRFLRYYGRVQHVVGVDVSEQMLNEARSKILLLSNSASVQLEPGDVFHLRFSDRHFQVTVVWRLLHLLPKHLLAPAIRELCRITNNELLVQTYTPIGLTTRMSDWFAKPFLRMFHSTHATSDQYSNCPSRSSPWSHIPAYYHERSLINSLFGDNGFVQGHSRVLGRYGNCWVRANIFLRSGGH